MFCKKERKKKERKEIDESAKIVVPFLCVQAVEGLLEGYTVSSMEPNAALRYRDAHILVLKSLQDQRAYGPQWTNKQVTRWVCIVYW